MPNWLGRPPLPLPQRTPPCGGGMSVHVRNVQYSMRWTFNEQRSLRKRLNNSHKTSEPTTTTTTETNGQHEFMTSALTSLASFGFVFGFHFSSCYYCCCCSLLWFLVSFCVMCARTDKWKRKGQMRCAASPQADTAGHCVGAAATAAGMCYSMWILICKAIMRENT